MLNPISRRVLIADDEPGVLALLRDFLAGQGYEVSAVATGAEALEAVPIFQPNVIMVDMHMPGLSGRDVLDSLRRTGVSIPVILLSGNPRIVGEGFFGVLEKPFSLRTMAQLVSAAIEDAGNTPADER